MKMSDWIMSITDGRGRHLTMDTVRVRRNPNMDEDAKRPMFHWLCVIHAPGEIEPDGLDNRESMTIYYSQGIGHRKAFQGGWRPNRPGVNDVLDCLASDVSGIDDDTFSGWAENMGYGSDSLKAKAIYETIQAQAVDLKRLLGAEKFRELIEDVERL